MRATKSIVRYYKITSKDDPATFEVWLSEKEHIFFRSVIMLNAQDGASILVDLKKIPVMQLVSQLIIFLAVLRSLINRNALIAIIVIVLVGFILLKGAVSLVCAPNEPNSVANVISNLAPTSATN